MSVREPSAATCSISREHAWIRSRSIPQARIDLLQRVRSGCWYSFERRPGEIEERGAIVVEARAESDWNVSRSR